MQAIIVTFALGTVLCSAPMDYRRALEVEVILNEGQFSGPFSVIREKDLMYQSMRKACQELTGF